jgi:uncharacterized membrane protein
MARFQKSIEINASVQDCYAQWMKFEEFPQFMDHVQSITRQGDNRWHWIVDGPMGAKVEWDAIMDGSKEKRLISWHTISEPTVNAQGAVLFEEIRPDLTRVISTLQYEPPAGKVGELVAELFSNPEKMVEQDLSNFKKLLETQKVSAFV